MTATYEFRQSWLSTFMQCPEQARAEMYGEVEREESDSTACGTAVHAGIEYCLQSRIDGEPYGSTPYDVIEQTLADLSPWVRTKYSKRRVHELAMQGFTNFERLILPEVKPVAVEKSFNVQFGFSPDVRLKGTMDCVDERGFVWDWKTGARSMEHWEKHRWAVQPTVYCWAEQCAEFRYGIMLHSNEVQLLRVTRDQRHFDWLYKQCQQIVRLIESGLPTWPLNDSGWHCSPSWCANWQNCKGSVMGDDWKQ